MVTLITTLISIVVIGFMWGGFIALVITIIAGIIGYFTGIYVALAIVILVAIGSGIQKYRSK